MSYDEILQMIVHGSAAATRHLADYCRKNNVVQGKIFTPTLGEVIDATIESHIFQVTLSDQLMSSLMFQTVSKKLIIIKKIIFILM
jgi:ABC-type branched-subunit amino acid transport system substrate-binding protein